MMRAITMAFFLLLQLDHVDVISFAKMSKIHGRSSFDANEAGVFIEDMVFHFAKYMPNDNIIGEGDLNDIAPYLYQKKFLVGGTDITFDCQCHVFSPHGHLLESYPQENFDETKRQIFLYAEKNETEYKYVHIITDLVMFLNQVGYFCLFCHTKFGGKGHFCKIRQSCRACHRPIAKDMTYKNKQLEMYYCASRHEKKVCDKCNSTTRNDNCAKKHERVCRKTWKCGKCNKILSLRGGLSNKTKMAETHICGMEICKFCTKQYSGKNHFCSLPTKVNVNFSGKLAFLHSMSNKQERLQCLSCSQGNGFCDFCQKKPKKEEINVISFLAETSKRSVFDLFGFADFMQNTVKKNFHSFSIPTEIKDYNFGPAQTSFGKVKKIFSHQIWAKDTLSRFLDFLLNNFSNTSILVHENETAFFHLLIECLIANSITPKVVESGLYIYMIEVPSHQIRFINTKNYQMNSISEMRLKLKMKNIFFPHKWNDTRFYDYGGKPPTVNDLYHFSDSDEIVKEKEKFVKTLTDQWNFRENAVKYSTDVALLLAKQCHKFLMEASKCQQSLKIDLGMDNTSFLHPFLYPHFTLPSYGYNLLKTYCKNFDKLCVMKPAIDYRSSAGEIEYVEYIKYTQRGKNKIFFDAWSPYGQKKFLNSYPDLYDSNDGIAYYYHGCLVQFLYSIHLHNIV